MLRFILFIHIIINIFVYIIIYIFKFISSYQNQSIIYIYEFLAMLTFFLRHSVLSI